MKNQSSIHKAHERHRANKALEHLLGMIEGMIADMHLHEKEIALLNTWLSANPEAASAWPGSIIAQKIREVMADGVITNEERGHLLTVLSELIGTEFAETGSASAEVATLPIDDARTIEIRGANICLTGEFLYGTRAACESLTLKAGGMPLNAVTKKTDILVVGSRVATDWVHTTFGRKIQKAAEMKQQGHPIEIISEKRWLDATR